MDELDTVFELMSHDRIEVRKRAVDILAVTTVSTSPQSAEMVTKLCNTAYVNKLLTLLAPNNLLLHGTLLTTLVNMCANPEVGVDAVRMLVEVQSIPRLLRLLNSNPAPALPVQDLMLMLLTNLTTLGGNAAASSLLQVEASDDMRGFYFDQLLDQLTSCRSPTTSRWILNIITNATAEDFAKEVVLKNEDAMQKMVEWVKECESANHTYFSLAILRNCALYSSATTHDTLAKLDVLGVVLHNLHKDRPHGSADMCNAAVEFVYAMCTSKEGVEAMESHNGKKILQDVVANTEHTIHLPECEDAKVRVADRLLNVLDDVQDVVVKTDDDFVTPGEHAAAAAATDITTTVSEEDQKKASEDETPRVIEHPE